MTGLSLGGVYALSGVGMVVLYRATGVLNLAFGAVGAMGALIAWQLINHSGFELLARVRRSRVLFGGVMTLAYGMVFGPALALRDPLVKATATLGLTLILLGVMDLLWPSSGGASRALTVPTDNNTFQVGEISVTYTNVIALALGLVDHGRRPRRSCASRSSGTAMRAMANDREITATLGRPGATGDRGRVVRVRVPGGSRRRAARRPGRARRDEPDVPGHLHAGGHADRAACDRSRSRSSRRS